MMSRWYGRTMMVAAGVLATSAIACGGNRELEQNPAPQPSPTTASRPTQPRQTQRPTTPPNTDAAARARTQALQTLAVRVHFDFDRAEIKPEYARILEEKARILRQHPQLRITVEGHCDERGSSEYNMALGQRRSEVTKRFLVGLGIAESRIQTVSYGRERPLVALSGESAWSQNRRAEFIPQNPDAIAFVDADAPIEFASR